MRTIRAQNIHRMLACVVVAFHVQISHGQYFDNSVMRSPTKTELALKKGFEEIFQNVQPEVTVVGDVVQQGYRFQINKSNAIQIDGKWFAGLRFPLPDDINIIGIQTYVGCSNQTFDKMAGFNFLSEKGMVRSFRGLKMAEPLPALKKEFPEITKLAVVESGLTTVRKGERYGIWFAWDELPKDEKMVCFLNLKKRGMRISEQEWDGLLRQTKTVEAGKWEEHSEQLYSINAKENIIENKAARAVSVSFQLPEKVDGDLVLWYFNAEGSTSEISVRVAVDGGFVPAPSPQSGPPIIEGSKFRNQFPRNQDKTVSLHKVSRKFLEGGKKLTLIFGMEKDTVEEILWAVNVWSRGEEFQEILPFSLVLEKP